MGLLDEDRLMRQIKKLVEGLLRVRALRTSSRDEEALDAIGELLEGVLQLKPTLVYQMTPTTLLSLLSPAGEADLDRLVAAGALLGERAKILDELGRDDEAERHAAQALLLLEEAQALDLEGRYAEHYAGIDVLRERLA